MWATVHDKQVSSLLIGDCILDALQHHSIHEIGAQNVLPESVLLEQRECVQRGRGMAAQTRSVIHAVGGSSAGITHCRYFAYLGSLKY